jgi:drug/metabolite transporter (DMT)-like permease
VFGLDWRLLSIGVVISIGIYSIVFKRFFDVGGDWRLLLPIIGAVGIVSLAYFAFTFKEIKYTQETLVLLALICVSIGLSVICSLLVYSDPGAKMSVAVPIMGLAAVVTAILAILFLGENVSMRTWAGIALSLVAIYLLAS